MAVDIQLLFAINALARSTPWLQPLMQFYATAGGFVVFAELMFMGWWLARSRTNLSAVAAALWTPVGMLVALVINQPISAVFAERRPYLMYPNLMAMAEHSLAPGFPSDHAVLAGAVTATLFMVSRPLGWGAALAAAVMAFSRVYVAEAYPSDVLVGLPLGAVLSVTCFLLVRRDIVRLLGMTGSTIFRALVTNAARARLPKSATCVPVGLPAGRAQPERVVPGLPPLAKFSSVAHLRDAVTTREKVDKTAKITLTGCLDGRSDQEFYGVGVLRLDESGTSLQFAERVQRPGADPVEVTLVVQPGAIFLKPPPGTVMPLRKSWLQLGPNTCDPLYRRFLAMAAALRTYADPQAFFTQYGDAITITDSTSEPIDGARCVRYDLHADMAKAAAANQSNPAIWQALREALATGQTGVDLKIWLDQDNRPLRTLIDQPIPGVCGRYTLDSRYSTWGKSVSIGTPDPIVVIQQ